MDNTSKKLFKKSFVGGFKREDVADYIADLAAKHAQEIEKLQGELKAAETKNSELLSANNDLVGEKKELLSRIDKLTATVAEGDAAKAELLALEEVRANIAADKESLETELASVKNALSASEAKVSEYQAREQEIRKNKEQIANLELEARNRSNRVEEETRNRMASEVAENKAYIDGEIKKLNQYRETVYAEIENLVAEMSESYQSTKDAVGDFKIGFKSVVTELAREIDSISDASLNIEDAFNALSSKCKNMREGQ